MRSTIVAALAAVALPFVAAQQAYDYATTVNAVAAAGKVVIVQQFPNQASNTLCQQQCDTLAVCGTVVYDPVATTCTVYTAATDPNAPDTIIAAGTIVNRKQGLKAAAVDPAPGASQAPARRVRRQRKAAGALFDAAN